MKLNPTLLGEKPLRNILNTLMHHKASVPDIAFEHDLKYSDAIRIIKNLQQIAENKGLEFGVKLTNTLEVENHKDQFSEDEKMMYMSGRALHPYKCSAGFLIGKGIPSKIKHLIFRWCRLH